MGNFWSMQNCRVHDRQGLEGSEGRNKGMIVEFWKHIPARQPLHLDIADQRQRTFAVGYRAVEH